jgi:hypothetical protein
MGLPCRVESWRHDPGHSAKWCGAVQDAGWGYCRRHRRCVTDQRVRDVCPYRAACARHGVLVKRDSSRRKVREIRGEYLTGPPSFEKYKVVIPAANGSGVLGEVFSSPLVAGPHVAVTQTFITVGCFDNETATEACLKYVKSKFARTLLGVLKITQHNPANVWKYVPLQDFTSASDIDWSKPIPPVDQQLYAKYVLDSGEIASSRRRSNRWNDR